MTKSKVLVAQGGGPTAVINESLVGTILTSRQFEDTEAVYGAFHGVRGIVNEDFIDLTGESVENLENVAKTPCSALGSTRDKPDRKYCQDIFKVLKAHGIGTFFYIGGNDSSDTLRILAAEAVNADYPLRCIHIPKTIDNDLTVNDHTPGYPSAAKFVASAFAGVNLDNRALKGVYVGVVMGRQAGFLTAAAALGREIARLDKAVSARAKDDPAVRLLMTVPGVGPVTALAFAATIGDAGRFAKSRTVGAYIGLTSRRWQSGEMDYSGRISKHGDSMLRALLYEAANSLLTGVRKAHPLKDWARRVKKRTSHKKACVALARKLAVILHRMLITGEVCRWPQKEAAA